MTVLNMTTAHLLQGLMLALLICITCSLNQQYHEVPEKPVDPCRQTQDPGTDPGPGPVVQPADLY